MAIRWLGTFLRNLGVVAFAGGLLIGVPILFEGVTGLIGEGDRMRDETDEQIEARYSLVGMFWGIAIGGWVVARIGAAIGDPNSKPPLGLLRVVSELLMLIGGFSLALGGLIATAPRAGGYETPVEYRRVMYVGLIGGPIVFAAGWAIRRRAVRKERWTPKSTVQP